MKGVRQNKNLGCGYVIKFNGMKKQGFSLTYHDNFLGEYETKEACEIVKGIHRREEAIRKLNNRLLNDKDYQLQQYYKSLEN